MYVVFIIQILKTLELYVCVFCATQGFLDLLSWQISDVIMYFFMIIMLNCFYNLAKRMFTVKVGMC